MTALPVTITARARADLNDIRDWYQAIRSELVDGFNDDVEAVMAAIGERPHSFPEVEKGVRRALCRTFPYKVYFTVKPDEVRVQAVYHANRDPKKWDER